MNNDANDNYDDGGNDNTNINRSNPNLDLGNNQNDNLSSLQSNMLKDLLQIRSQMLVKRTATEYIFSGPPRRASER